MKKLEVCLAVLFVASILLPSTLLGQDTTPPKCCPNKSLSAGAFGGDACAPQFQGQFVVSDEMLQARGISRSQYVDRLSESLFPGAVVDLVYPSAGFGDPYLMADQDNYLFRIPLYSVTAEELDGMNELGLADDMRYVSVLFVGRVSKAQN